MKFRGLRFKGTVKASFRKEFAPIARYGCWEDAEDPVIKNFANNLRAHAIPCGILNNMPNSWERWAGEDFIENSYDITTGYWTFQCSLPYVCDAVGRFLELVPYFIESVDYCEVYLEGEIASKTYELVNGVMRTKGEIKYD